MSKEQDSMYASFIGAALAIILVFFGLLIVRFVFGGPEDTWICSHGHWVMHGKPAAVKPTSVCPR